MASRTMTEELQSPSAPSIDHASVAQPSSMPETRWTLVQRVQSHGESKDALTALGDIMKIYWQPLYAYARRRGESPTDAEDMVQGFYEMLIHRGSIHSVNKERGRLRSFLLTALERFIIDQWQKRNAGKRGSGKHQLSLEHEEAENRYLKETSHNLSAERLFDREWILTLLSRVMDSLSADYQRRGKQKVFEALSPSLEWHGNDESYGALAATLGLSENAVKQAVFRMRKKYRDLLRAEVAATISNPADLDAELMELLQALSH
jgi:RNA polymerase sigma factor (sigma-70 family)